MTRTPAFAAVDLGASSARVVVGQVVGEPGAKRIELTEVHRVPNGPVALPARTPSGQVLHWDVLALYRGLLDGLRAATRQVGRLDGMGIDGWAVDYGLLDADGALVATPVHYRDPRTTDVPERVFATVPARELYARTGLQVQPFNTVFQLLAERPAALDRARRMLLVPDLLAYWLTGVEGAEVTNASTTGLLDATTRTWATDLAARVGIDADLLPPLHEPGAVVGPVRPEVLTEVGHADALPVLAVGSHDTASAVAGIPAAGENFAYVSCGTWSLVGLELPGPVLTEDSRAANFTNELGVDGTVRYLKNVMGLWLLQEALRTWDAAGLPTDLGELLEAAAQEPALGVVVDADDGAFLAPGDMPARIGVAAAATGQTPPSTQAEAVRCIVDSLALAYRRAIRQAERLSGRTVRVVHLVGGGARNELLCRLTADATGLPVLAGPVEAAALGNVLVQARAAGVLSGDLAALRAVGARSAEVRRYEPSGEVPAEAWDEAERRLGLR